MLLFDKSLIMKQLIPWVNSIKTTNTFFDANITFFSKKAKKSIIIYHKPLGGRSSGV